ncbi:hypothetical protein [Christiangramia crocea]|uniref:Uncharacterized protein n=1 Tax=Christiangramia crocea TaxID=2904124 RepID=A0A9X1UX18_9FLAO|nr:hypothetical protein [Gramella crocea]MCG9970873.1 hypothetical protein [Gramella crocea]
MKFYYSGKNTNTQGVIMVHSEDCKALPDVLQRIYIGMFPNSNLAITSAKQKLQLTRVKVCTCCVE